MHAAMLLQASGHAYALRTLIGAEQDRGLDFLRLAVALSDPLSTRQPGETAPRRYAAGGAEMNPLYHLAWSTILGDRRP